MARSIIPAMPRCSPGGRASSPQGASPQCASSHDRGTHLSGTVWLGRNIELSCSPQCAQTSSLYGITCRGPRQGSCVCAKAVRFPAGAWPPHHGRARESSAPPARSCEAGPSEAARLGRAPYDLQGRPAGLPSRRNTDPSRRNSPAPRRGGAERSERTEKRASLFCVPVATARPDLRITRQCGVRVWWVCELLKFS